MRALMEAADDREVSLSLVSVATCALACLCSSFIRSYSSRSTVLYLSISSVARVCHSLATLSSADFSSSSSRSRLSRSFCADSNCSSFSCCARHSASRSASAAVARLFSSRRTVLLSRSRPSCFTCSVSCACSSSSVIARCTRSCSSAIFFLASSATLMLCRVCFLSRDVSASSRSSLHSAVFLSRRRYLTIAISSTGLRSSTLSSSPRPSAVLRSASDSAPPRRLANRASSCACSRSFCSRSAAAWASASAVRSRSAADSRPCSRAACSPSARDSSKAECVVLASAAAAARWFLISCRALTSAMRSRHSFS
mmetsp:Transcript_21198/g.59670  ORF Transcript_21198/g.59670 Transcript_21198/m.59670 type:complete len:312 (-) Transcript_21198:442-1377(-)